MSNEHSAPGKIMLIAQNLLCRAENMRSSANTVEECILGAVLANDALELLRYKTPTLALQALSLKHEFEVRAEVAFLGVGHHFDLSKRFEELTREISVASRFFNKDTRKASELDALVSIGTRLMLLFREAGHFDEELKCLAKIRSWHRRPDDRGGADPQPYRRNYDQWRPKGACLETGRYHLVDAAGAVLQQAEQLPPGSAGWLW
jgi:hypothetical protein